MTLDVKFEEQSQTFDADFNEQEQNLNVDFGELQTVGGGGSGKNGATFIPNVSQSGIISWTNDKGLENPTPVNIKGAKGDKGEQGIQGEKGKDGANGQDGFSPIVAVTDIEGGHRVTITDKNGAKTFEVMNGKDGQGGNGGSVQSDWNQSDSTAQDYIKNRPFYTEYAYEPLVYNTDYGDYIDFSALGFGLASKISNEPLPLDKETILSSKFNTQQNIQLDTFNKIILADDLTNILGTEVYLLIEYKDSGDEQSSHYLCYFPISGTVDVMGVPISIPSVGLYLTNKDFYSVLNIYKGTIHKINTKYITSENRVYDFSDIVLTDAYGDFRQVYLYSEDAIKAFRRISDFTAKVKSREILMRKITPEQAFGIYYEKSYGYYTAYTTTLSIVGNSLATLIMRENTMVTKKVVQAMIDEAIAKLQ